ncbi:MAG TPA: hypothetical protein VGM23_08310 [Armatimonadota bacterium]|jgi:hypothetical protein
MKHASPISIAYAALYGVLTLALAVGSVSLLIFIIRSLIGSSVLAALFGKDDNPAGPPPEDYK